jgi:uncharacterized metal-binding protein YceD (DUF177 family)
MKIFLHELSDLETELDFSEAEPWVQSAVTRVDEQPEEALPAAASSGAAAQPRRTQVHFSLSQVDEVVVVNGQVDTSVRLLCSRCANVFSMPLKPNFSALFCKDPVMAGVAHLGRARDQGTEVLKPMGQNKGHARHAHDTSLDDVEGGGGQDLDITYIAEDFIDLGHVLTEQLQLLLPFQPLCKAECKGICVNCGADQNLGRCACAKLVRQTPFSVLKDLKL